MCTPVIWIFFYLSLVGPPSAFLSFPGNLFFIFQFTHRKTAMSTRSTCITAYNNRARPRSRVSYSLSSPPRVVSAQNRLLYTHMCTIIYIFVSALCSVRVCVFILSPPCAAVWAVWSTDSELLLYIYPSGGGISPYLYRNDNIIPNDNDTIIIIVLTIMETVKRVVAVAAAAVQEVHPQVVGCCCGSLAANGDDGCSDRVARPRSAAASRIVYII